jgi:putative transposase
MPRPPRVVIAEWPVHIVHRGSNRMACFRDDNDHLAYLALLHQIIPASRCGLHAYCLMTNHVHLLVTPSTPLASSNLMKALAQRYSYYFNRKYQRTGPLWEGRFRSCVVESSTYVLACYRYIELNPVRAGIVNHPGAYLWSSYAVNSGARRDQKVSEHSELTAIGSVAYRQLLEDRISEETVAEIREATNGGFPLDGERGKRVRGKPGRPPVSSADNKSVSDTDLFSGGGVS